MKKVAISKSGKYCSNPETHILGSLLCCKGLIVDWNLIDKDDVVDVGHRGEKRNEKMPQM